MRPAAELRTQAALDRPVGIVPWITLLPHIRRGRRLPSRDSRFEFFSVRSMANVRDNIAPPKQPWARRPERCSEVDSSFVDRPDVLRKGILVRL